MEGQFQPFRDIVKSVLEAGCGKKTTAAERWQDTCFFPEWLKGTWGGTSVTYLRTHVSIHPSILPPIHLPVPLLLSPSISPLIFPPTYLPICSHLSIHPSCCTTDIQCACSGPSPVLGTGNIWISEAWSLDSRKFFSGMVRPGIFQYACLSHIR